MSTTQTNLPRVASREEWLEARKALLEEEKAMTRARDELNRKRRELPMVRITKDYRFTGPEGEVTLPDLFAGHHQLITSHFMFDPEWEDGCPSCSAGADEWSPGLQRHLETRDTRLVYVSRAPLETIERYKGKKGWTFPWYSSNGSDFNYDFHATVDANVAPVEYNFRTLPELEEHGFGWMGDGKSYEQPGLSCFLRVGDDVFHTFSQYARGAEWLGGSYAFLDLTALGRQEDWEEPKGRSDAVREGRPDFAS
jgi:predicted dithiol-disulfide oxidoreductase (DUF899 family)